MKLSSSDYNMNVSEIVQADHRTADIFREYGINYCCGGKMLLEEVCELKKIRFPEVVARLNDARKRIFLPNNIQFQNWKIEFLIEYITNIHHAYLKDALPTTEIGLLGFVSTHKKQSSDFERILIEFRNLYTLLSEEMREQEDILFPYIKQIENAYRRKETYGKLFVRTLAKPLKKIKSEQHAPEDILEDIRAITSHYNFPDNACTNHQVIFHRLKELDNDIIQHKYLEDKILFPKVAEMEQHLLEL